MDQPNYRVLLDGRTVGPYDRKTIVGMRIKRMLTGDHLLVAADGTRLTVRELVSGPAGGRRPAGAAAVLGTSTGILVHAQRRGIAIPRFQGELEVRVHADVLRLAGRRRHRFGWKDDRVKIALRDLVHARASGPQVDLWLQPAGAKRPQRLALHMFTAEAAAELIGWLPPAATDPRQPGAARAATADPAAAGGRALAVAVLGVAVVIALVLLVLAWPRSH